MHQKEQGPGKGQGCEKEGAFKKDDAQKECEREQEVSKRAKA